MAKEMCSSFLALTLLAACGAKSDRDHGAESAAVSAAPIQSVVASGLAHPWDIAFLNNRKALVTEKDGRLQLLDLVTGRFQPVAGMPDDVDNIRRDDPRDNSGLFSVELDPDFVDNRWVYVAYSSGDENGTALRVIRGKWSGDASLTDVEEVFQVEPLSTDRFHYGGGIVFGGDGKLYITAGERIFDEMDEPELPVAQNLADMRGKIYRLNPDGSIPEDNPVFEEPTPPGLYALGIRASQGTTLHPQTGAIWFSEHGSMQGDEINILRPGANYGWPVKTTGRYRNPDYIPPSLDREYTDPIYSWEHTVAPTGLTFYTGDEFPAWKGQLFVAGLAGGSLWRLDVDGETVARAVWMFEDDPVRLRNVQQSPDGVLYLLTDEAEGRVIRIGAG